MSLSGRFPSGAYVVLAVSIACSSLLVVSNRCQAQLYSVKPPRKVWDSWLLREGEDYHLFYLQGPRDDRHIGRAVSKDLLHWKRLPWIDSVGKGDAWDRKITHTGWTVKIGDRYACLYGSSGTGRQLNGVMFSDDLLHWQKYPGNPVLVSTPPRYGGKDWRDPTAYYDADEGLWHGYICAQTAFGEPAIPKLPRITDKTLVVWISLATLDQGGGSALTLDKDNVVFDGVVFAEKWSRRWMNGSNNARRGQKDQSAYPVESADAGELLQVAIVYRGKDITIYRNGQQYTRYAAPEQASFGDGTAALMGLRHAAVKVCEANCLAGSIEEARVYSEALSQQAIAAMELGTADNPKPLAQWTFEDGTTKDAMGTFPPGELRGGAEIAGGQLHLDGIDDYMITSRTLGRNVPCIGHFTSKDLIHWDYLPRVYENADFADLEVPDYFTQGGWHYFLFSSARTRRDTPTRRRATGTFYVMSENRDGPYRLPPDPLILGSGNGRLDNYVGRALPEGDKNLMYHHTVGGVVVWGTIKRIEQNDDGTLRLEYWSGLDGLETNVLFDSTQAPEYGDKALAGSWKVDERLLVGQISEAGTGLFVLPVDASDLMATCRLGSDETARAGLLCRFDGQQGIGVFLDRSQRTVQVAEVRHQGDQFASKILDTRYEAPFAEGSDYLRLFVRDHRVEVYLNDEWMFGITIPDSFVGSGVGACLAGGETEFSEVRVAEIERLVPTDP